MDPPYASADAEEAAALLARYSLLAAGGVLAAERPAGGDVPASAYYMIKKIKVYGNTQLVFYEKAANPLI